MIRVGFVLSLDESWHGGLNYFKNLLNAVYQLPNREIDIVIFTGSNNSLMLMEGLPKVQVVISSAFDQNTLLWWIRRFFKKLFYRDPVLWVLIRQYNVKLLSHFNEAVIFKSTPIISWIPDFQHLHLPHFFTQKEITARNKLFTFLTNYSKIIIMSSNAAKKDFIEFAPLFDKKVQILQFCVNPDLTSHKNTDLSALQKKYKFQGNYFFLPNQFWAHKNHQVVIDALALAINKNKNIKVICTGNTKDYRQPEYFADIQKQILALELQDHFKILGLVPYKDLIALMRHSIAVVNPSMFEGWSTTVEESKCLNKTILLSNIEVHMEQNPKRAHYFSVDDSQSLAEYFLSLMVENAEIIDHQQYEDELLIYKQKFIEFGSTYQKTVQAALINY